MPGCRGIHGRAEIRRLRHPDNRHPGIRRQYFHRVYRNRAGKGLRCGPAAHPAVPYNSGEQGIKMRKYFMVYILMSLIFFFPYISSAGIVINPILGPSQLLNDTMYKGREVTKNLYQGDGIVSGNFQPFPILGLTMVTLPEEDNLIDNIEQIKIDKYATMPSTDVIEMALYYDQNSDYYFDPELTAGGLSNDTKIATAQYDPGIDAWYFSNMSAFPETTITKVPKSFFVAVRLSTTATKGTYFGIQISSTQSITPAGSVPIDNVNFHVKTSTWTVEKSPPKVFAQLTDIAAWYKVSGATEPTKQSRMFPGSDNIGMLQIGLVTQYFDGVVGGMLIERTGTGQDSDLTGVKIFMDGRDDNDDGLVDFSSNTDAAFNPADDMAITNWIPFSDYNANCSFSKSQILNGSTTRYFFVAYKVADTASISATHGARITSFDLPEGSMQAYTPVQSSLIPVIQTTSTVSVTMCDSVYYHYSTGTFQAQPNVEMMRLKLATNASTAIWEALQVERTGTGGPQDPTNPEGRN